MTNVKAENFRFQGLVKITFKGGKGALGHEDEHCDGNLHEKNVSVTVCAHMYAGIFGCRILWSRGIVLPIDAKVKGGGASLWLGTGGMDGEERLWGEGSARVQKQCSRQESHPV